MYMRTNKGIANHGIYTVTSVLMYFNVSRWLDKKKLRCWVIGSCCFGKSNFGAKLLIPVGLVKVFTLLVLLIPVGLVNVIKLLVHLIRIGFLNVINVLFHFISVGLIKIIKVLVNLIRIFKNNVINVLVQLIKLFLSVRLM